MKKHFTKIAYSTGLSERFSDYDRLCDGTLLNDIGRVRETVTSRVCGKMLACHRRANGGRASSVDPYFLQGGSFYAGRARSLDL